MDQINYALDGAIKNIEMAKECVDTAPQEAGLALVATGMLINSVLEAISRRVEDDLRKAG